MSNENDLQVKIMALGRPFELGMVYDVTTEKTIPGVNLWDERLISEIIAHQDAPSSTVEIHTDDSFIKKADLLGMSTNHKMSALVGDIELCRSANLLFSHKTSTREQRFIVKYSITTRTHEIPVSHVYQNNQHDSNMFHQQRGTHAVVGILYGAEVYFIFSRNISNSENHIEIERYVTELLTKMITVPNFNSDDLILDDGEKKIVDSLTCQYIGDFDLCFDPTTFGQAATLLHALPNLIGEDGKNAIPKQVWLYPLHLLGYSNLMKIKSFEISNNTLTKLFEVLNGLYQWKLMINHLKNTLSCSILYHQNEEQLSLTNNRIDEFEATFREKIKQIWKEIRCGFKREDALVSLLEHIDSLVTNKQTLNKWIHFTNEKREVVTYIYDTLGDCRNITITDFSLFNSWNNRKSAPILGLSIHIIEKIDPFSTLAFQCLNNDDTEQTKPMAECNSWQNHDNLELIRNKVNEFLEFVKVNRKRKDIKFAVRQQYMDDFHMNQNVSTILYQNGTPINFEIPSKLGQPHASSIVNRDLTLTWAEPIHGSKSVQKYNIYSRTNEITQWKLIVTTDGATGSAIISNLDPGKYQFAIQGVTLVGDTPMSDFSAEQVVETLPASIPRSTTKTPLPIITANKITTEEAILDMTPAWFEPIKPPSPDKIRLPVNYNKDSPIEVRTYDCLSVCRTMMKKTNNVDFVTEPFLPNVDNTETLVVVLNELLYQMGTHIAFTNEEFTYDDSDYRTACGIMNLGSIHSFLTSQGTFDTAKFSLHLKLKYDEIITSNETLKNFVLTLINEISTVLQCDKNFVRVFSVNRSSDVVVQCGITTPQANETKRIAETFKQKLNRNSKSEFSHTLRYLCPTNYDYKLEPVIAVLQLQPSDFEPHYNRFYPDAKTETRGGYPYHFPKGWYRHALKVDNKYKTHPLWLGMTNSKGEWAAAFHGTNAGAAKGIKEHGLLHEFVTSDVMKDDAERQYPSIPKVKGLYVATHCEAAASYSRTFDVPNPKGEKITYKVVFQCRVRPGKFTEHQRPVSVGYAWRVFDERAIRPYGLLLKKS